MDSEIKSTDYKLLCKQLEALAEISTDWMPVLANASALLYDAMDDINWAGFYLVRNVPAEMRGSGTDEMLSLGTSEALLLGPFQGKPACVQIKKGSGVCGTAWAEGVPQLVPNVHEFPGHIACDSAANSEIVIPIYGTPAAYGNTYAYASPDESTAHRNKNYDDNMCDNSLTGIVGVLDIDSPSLNRFGEDDLAGLQEFVNTIERTIG